MNGTFHAHQDIDRLAPRRVERAADFGRVALLVGGDSAEREVSLDGGAAIARSFERSGITHELFDGAPALFESIRAGRVDRVFNLMHGPGGEDGAIQGALDLMGVPVTGSGVLGSALTMDKVRSKWIWQRLGMDTAEFRTVPSGPVDAASLLEGFELPVFVKPNGLGSSIGVSRVAAPEALAPAVEDARRHGGEVLVEQGIAGGEYFAGIIGRTVLPLIRIETPRAFYDYEAKYQSDDTRYYCPCGLEPDLERTLRERSLAAFDALGASGWGRVDFILDADERAWFLEVNTAPGMTDHSLVPQAAETIGVEFDELVWRILETSL
ncbi:MAG: D-alanine--D-alanine ligase [Gammaproteobacteria bacterium]